MFGVKLHLNLPLSHDSEPSNVLYPNSRPNFIIVVRSFTCSINQLPGSISPKTG